MLARATLLLAAAIGAWIAIWAGNRLRAKLVADAVRVPALSRPGEARITFWLEILRYAAITLFFGTSAFGFGYVAVFGEQ